MKPRGAAPGEPSYENLCRDHAHRHSRIQPRAAGAAHQLPAFPPAPEQLRVRPATRRHDESWQVSQPVCPQTALDLAFNLPSDALSTFLHCTWRVGTQSGVFLGFIGSGASRRPVYFEPWS